MTTDDVPATNRPASLMLEEGPLHDALVAVDEALSDIELTKARLTDRRHDFARVFRAEVAAHSDDESFVADLGDVIRALYWDHQPMMRMADLSARSTATTGSR